MPKSEEVGGSDTSERAPIIVIGFKPDGAMEEEELGRLFDGTIGKNGVAKKLTVSG